MDIPTLISILIILAMFLYPPLLIGWYLYQHFYYKGESFLSIKNSINEYIADCNNMNEYIEELKNTHIGDNRLDYGVCDYTDNSIYHYKRPELSKVKFAPYVYNCSSTICDNAKKQPFKYICKYFNIKANEETLSKWENILHNFQSVEEGKRLLVLKKNDIMNSINSQIPFLIKYFNKKKLEQKLGFKEIDLRTTYFPQYIFNYVSSGGYASTNCKITLDIENLNKFVLYISELVKFKKSAEAQRMLMTTKLRQEILIRDNYTCQNCGISIRDEQHLLLEIDHIVPVSKGGITTKANLRTLCWKCNRSKGSKIIDSSYIET